MKSIICTIIKDERQFIREWVDWHLNIRFDKIYIFEDFGSTSHSDLLEDLIKEKKVEVVALDDGKVPVSNAGYGHRPSGVKPTQYSLYIWFFNKVKKENLADWIAFIDVDEFINFENGYNLERLEEEYSNKGGILLSWKQYGANGHIKRPEGGVVENYTGSWQPPREGDEWGHKSLVNVAVTEGFETVHTFKGCEHTNGGDKRAPQCYDKAWINHYFTKSWEDWCDRIFNRGNMHNDYRTLDTFFKYNTDLYNNRRELIESVRYKHARSATWLSREFKIISGGNVNKLDELRKEHSNKHIKYG